MKSVENLMNANRNTTVGNHAVVIRDNVRLYTYHGNTICTVDTVAKTFSTSHCGWFTSSTTRPINDYTRNYLASGYTLVNHD